MKIVLTSEAKSDLEELRAYLLPVSPSGLNNVVSAIENKLRQIAEHPSSGRISPRDDVREAIETRFGFLIPYLVKRNTLYVLRIYGGKRKPLVYDQLPT